MILAAGGEVARNRDNFFPFRAHSDFVYMTGFPEPDAWWLMRVEPDGNTRDVIACRPRDPDREIWDGVRVGPEKAADRYGFDTAMNIADLDVCLSLLSVFSFLLIQLQHLRFSSI